MLRCSGCCCVWTADPPAPKNMAFHYGEDYHRAIRAGGERDAAARWKVPRRTIARYKKSGCILDIGCSSGGFLKTMNGWSLHGIELDPKTAERARMNVSGDIFVGNALEAPFAQDTFDVITCFDVLEHFYEPLELVRKIATWLKPGGVFYMRVPNVASWEARLLRSYWFGLELPRHLFHFSPSAVRNLMRSTGMEELSLTAKGTYIEPSVAYLRTRLVERLGFTPVPLVAAPEPGIAWKAVRKCIRALVLEPFGGIAGMAGAGACLDALFRKPGPSGTPGRAGFTGDAPVTSDGEGV